MKLNNILVVLIALLLIPAYCLMAQLTTGTTTNKEDNLVYLIPIKGPIMDKGLPYFTKRAVEVAKSNNAKLIIFEINTPGGAVSIGDEEYTMGIIKAIENASPITTIAFIANAAISAGSLISVSCDRIIMQPDATIGAAEVIAGDSSTPNPHQGKYTSAFEAIFRAKAQKKGYSPNLFAAMVNRNLKVFEVKVNGKMDFLTEEEINQAKMDGKDIVQIRRIGKPDEPLTLTAMEAKQYGITSNIVNKRDEIPPIFHIQNFSIIEMHPTWSEDLVILITNPIVSGILILVGLISIGMAFKAPGTGLPEVLAVICFALIFFGHYLAGLAAMTDVLLFVLGLGLIAVEIFLIPGFGIPGILGIGLILASLILSMQDFTLPSPNLPWQWNTFQYNVGVVIISSVSAMVVFLMLVRLIPYSPYLQRLVLKTAESSSAGFTSAPADYERLVGKQGIAFSYLRPSGKIKVGDELLDVVTEGEFIEKDTPVKVIQIEGSRIIVVRDENKSNNPKI